MDFINNNIEKTTSWVKNNPRTFYGSLFAIAVLAAIIYILHEKY